jgi:Spy/CpxP family protein refolding chaperone
MMRPISLAFVLALLAFGSAPALAQAVSPALAASTPVERAKIQTDFMKEKLALTAEQLPKVDALNLETAQKMEPVLKGSEGPLVKMRAAREIEQAKETALQGLLTPDQFQKFLASKEELKQKLEERLAQKAGSKP